MSEPTAPEGELETVSDYVIVTGAEVKPGSMILKDVAIPFLFLSVEGQDRAKEPVSLTLAIDPYSALNISSALVGYGGDQLANALAAMSAVAEAPVAPQRHVDGAYL